MRFLTDDGDIAFILGLPQTGCRLTGRMACSDNYDS
jgi:hypothetical protein